MTTYSDETQRLSYAALAKVPAAPASRERAEFCGSIMDDMRRRRRLGRSAWAR